MKKIYDYFSKQWIRWFLLAGLISLELLMSFSFLGYIHVEPISITFAYIPVMAAGCLLGPGESVVLGLIFGLSSMWKASAPYVSETDHLFSPFYSDSPAASLLLSVGTRILFGLIVGLLYAWARRAGRSRAFWIAIVSFAGKTLHTMLVYGAMGLFFPEYSYSILTAFSDFRTLSNLLTIVCTVLVVQVCWLFLNSSVFQKFQYRMEIVRRFRFDEGYHRSFLAAVILLMLSLSAAVAVYFVHRMTFVLEDLGLALSEDTQVSLLHLQIQFLLGILAITLLVYVLLLFNRRYSLYLNYKANLDGLTDVLSRKGFFQVCSIFLGKMEFPGYFLIMDVDRFKEINDQYGHPAGDEVLRRVVDCLRGVFSEMGLIGRMGGDEFSVLIHTPLTKTELEAKLSAFLLAVRGIPLPDGTVSCSVGVCPVHSPAPIEVLYEQADQMLYRAKESGRDQFVMAHGSAAANE